MTTRPFLLLALASACTLAAACGPKPLDPVAVMSEPVEWPVCLQSWMEERMRACPSPPVAGPQPPPADCQVADAVTWRLEKVALAPKASLRAAAPAELKRAEKAYDEAADARGRERARKAFEATLRLEDPAAKRHAQYMLGFMHQRAGRIDEAFEAWVQAQTLPPGSANDSTADAAREAFIELFALERTPIAAVPAFRRLGLRLFEGLDRLAHRYGAHGRWKQAAEVMADLRRRQPERACHHQLQVVDATRRQGDRNETAGALNQLLEELEKPIDLACRRQGMQQILALGDRWRDQALDASGTGKSQEIMRMASQAYEVALARFPTDDLQGPGVCRHVTRIWYDRASLLERAGDWEGCATAYDDALSIDATGHWGARGAVGAMTCHLASYTSLHEKLPTLPQRDRVNKQLDDADRWRSTLRSFHRYLCVSDPSQGEARTEAGLARGEVFLEGGALWESALAFRIAAFDATAQGPQGGGPRAGARYAVVMDGMAVDDDCRIELNRDLMQLARRHCPSATASESCATIDEVHQRLEDELGPRLP